MRGRAVANQLKIIILAASKLLLLALLTLRRQAAHRHAAVAALRDEISRGSVCEQLLCHFLCTGCIGARC